MCRWRGLSGSRRCSPHSWFSRRGAGGPSSISFPVPFKHSCDERRRGGLLPSRFSVSEPVSPGRSDGAVALRDSRSGTARWEDR
jgi:hypothetical protein